MASTSLQALSWPLYFELGYPVMKGSIHVPLNQIQLLIREEVLRFPNVNGGNREALPPRLRNDAVDTHKVRGVALLQAIIHIVEFCWPSLGWNGLSLGVLIDTLPRR